MFTTLDTFDTKYSADSVEWCPAEGFNDLFVCGTYQLVPGEESGSSETRNVQTRLGRIFLFRVIQEGALSLEQTLETAAVLDMKWAHKPFHGKILLGVVNSIGFLQVYLLSTEKSPRIEPITKIRIRETEDEILALSLDWNTARWTENSTEKIEIAVSDSKGTISLFSFDGENLEVRAVCKLHEFEAWITAFDYWSMNVIYSGIFTSLFDRPTDLIKNEHIFFHEFRFFFQFLDKLKRKTSFFLSELEKYLRNYYRRRRLQISSTRFSNGSQIDGLEQKTRGRSDEHTFKRCERIFPGHWEVSFRCFCRIIILNYREIFYFYSYDEILRLWDKRNFRAPISETNLHGGIWRLKWDPNDHKYLLAACMYGGFRGIDCSDEAAPRILAEYNEHQSIAYGCDWSFLNQSFLSSNILGESATNVALIATCSFYDHTLKISSLKLENS